MSPPLADVGAAPDLPPQTEATLHAIDERIAKIVADTTPALSRARTGAIAAQLAVNTASQLARTASSHLIVFVASVGGMVHRQGFWIRSALAAGLVLITGAETMLGFPGIRFALGHDGDITNPLQDPVALIAATGFAIASLKLAVSAASEWKAADRGVMLEPEPAEPIVDGRMPHVVLDPDAAALLPPSELAPLIADGNGAPVVALHGDASDADASADADRRRYGHVLRDSVTRRARLLHAGSMVLLGVLLWGFNGYLRAEYADRVFSHGTTAQVVGLGMTGANTATPPSTPPGLELILIALGIVFFVAMVLVAGKSRCALAQRERALEQARDRRRKELDQAIENALDAIGTFEEQRGKVEHARLSGRYTAATAISQSVRR
jgi:hypothetical protein